MPTNQRLPIVSSDDNTWGGLLNGFLLEALVDTTLYTYSATSAATNAGGTLNIAPTNPATGGTNYNLATTTYPGLVQLAGDLAGTYNSPALAAVTTGGTVGSSSAVPVITYDAKGRITSTTTAAITSGTQRTFAFFAG